jgi:phage-related baseplate assembly protein
MNEVTFVKVDAAEIEAELINNFEIATGETFYPGDERRIFLLQQVPVLVAQKNDINYTGNQNLLAFAVDEALDGLGEWLGVKRLEAQKALTTIQFNLSGAQVMDITVPYGTRVTPDGVLYFATSSDLIIPSGNITGTVLAKAMSGGEAYNNFIPGQIKTIVDPVPYVLSAVNINTSYNGADIESNDNYRARIQLAPESFSTAGPEGAYIYWAKTADINIQDVSVTSPTPGNVNVYTLMKDGIIPTQDILDKVYAEISPKNRRPLTDFVHALAPAIVNYDISLTYYISVARQSEEESIRKAIEGDDKVKGSIEEYIAWQYAKLGRDINPDYLKSLMFANGAFRIVPIAPVFTILDEAKVARVGAVSITYGGLI